MRAGLERAAVASGFELNDHDAVVYLVGPDQISTDHAIVIIAEEGSVTVRVSEVPDEAIWARIHILVRSLLASSSDVPLANGSGVA
jgi:hypothetical protein